MKQLLVLDVVGLTPRLLEHMPNLRALADRGFSAQLGTVLPAVTCSVQSSLLTGLLPAEHGVVGNGWYFRDLGEVLFWRQHNGLVAGEKLWDAARRVKSGYTVANICWWFAMGADVDWTVTPRPIYYADGRKEPDCYTAPADLHHELTAKLGVFPLFRYWGPTASIVSSRWIIDAARHVFATRKPDLSLVYVPHLDYDLQRFGPHGPEAVRAAAELDRELAPLLADAEAADAIVVALSEYGITPVDRPVHVNRVLREAGLLAVYTQDGMEYLDPWRSRAFGVADHQVAHVYVRDPADRRQVAELLAAQTGVEQVLHEVGRKAVGLDHDRAGDLVAVADARSWFTYYYWLHERHAPDFARSVEIHRKPGYDPAELHYDHRDPLVRVKAAVSLARKKAGMRYQLKVVPLDPSRVRGSHGRLPDDPADGPVLLCGDPTHKRDRLAATEVKQFLLDLALRNGAAGCRPRDTG